MNLLPTLFAEVSNCPDGETTGCLTTLPDVPADSATLTTALSIVFGIITAVTVIIIVIQGIKFVLSDGDPDKIASARKGIIYALIGLVLSLSANVIVVFVLKDGVLTISFTKVKQDTVKKITIQ